MSNLTPAYSLGDMIVHRTHGIGTIDAIEDKSINGVNIECFKVKTENGYLWFPTASDDSSRIHPLASQDEIHEATRILQDAPDTLTSDPHEWRQRIEEVQAAGDFLAICRLVRDLSILKSERTLNRTQDQALNRLIDRLLQEWAASSGVDMEVLRLTFQSYIKTSTKEYKKSA